MSLPRGEPKPPKADLSRTRVLSTLRMEATYYRCAFKGRPLVDWDDRADSRFSHPDLRYPILYLAPSKETAFWECFGDDLNDQLDDERILYQDKIEPRQWVEFVVPSLQIFDSSDPESLRSAGTDISSFMAPYPITQAWSAFLVTTSVQGIAYRSRLDSNQICLAIFGTDALKRPGAIAAREDGDLVSDTSFQRWLLQQNIGVV
jgi:hypothetical protein